VGDYLLMPDHLHLFCAPRDLAFTLGGWVKYWKSQFSRAHLDKTWKWQRAGFHHRIRSGQEFSEKWAYVQQNPVRKGLVKKPEDWLFRGKVYDVGWV
jgi:REP element-mobilizing transposase RayT